MGGVGTVSGRRADEPSAAAASAAEQDVDLIASYWMHAGDTKPFTGRQWSPWDFERRVEMLAEVGFNGVGIFHDDLIYVLDNEAPADNREGGLRWMKGVIEDNGLEHVELEFLVNWMLPEDDPRRQDEREIRQLLLDAAGALDARHIKVGNINGYPLSDDQLSRAFAQLCAEADDVDTNVGMEILPPDPNADTLDEVLAWVRGPDNGGLFLDTWHVNNIEGISYDDIRNTLSADDIVAVELDDGFTEAGEFPGFVERTVNLRRTLGRGDFDVEGFISAVRDAGFDGPWGNEILSEEYRRVEMEVAYPRVYESTASFLT